MMRGMGRFLVVVFVFVQLFVSGVYDQKRARAETELQTTETRQGTIDYMERLGGYFIRGENPGGEFFIVNQNPKILKALKESGKTVTIEGYTTNQGAEYFFILKIDGKKYTAAKSPK